MLVGDTNLVDVEILHISDGVVVDIVGNGQFDGAARVVHQVVHQVDALPVRMQLVLHADLSSPCNDATLGNLRLGCFLLQGLVFLKGRSIDSEELVVGRLATAGAIRATVIATGRVQERIATIGSQCANLLFAFMSVIPHVEYTLTLLSAFGCRGIAR